MKFWVDAQLPPLLAAWLSAQFNVEALSLRTLGLRDASDAAIFHAAQQQGIVIISKDRLCRVGFPLRATPRS